MPKGCSNLHVAPNGRRTSRKAQTRRAKERGLTKTENKKINSNYREPTHPSGEKWSTNCQSVKPLVHGLPAESKETRQPIPVDTLLPTIARWGSRNTYCILADTAQRMREKAKRRDWPGFILNASSPFRFTILNAIKAYLTDAEFWRSFREAWYDCENSWEDTRLIKSLLALNRKGAKWMMSEEEQAALSRLRDTIRIYRGATVQNKVGSSWTLSKSIAEWFAAHRQCDPSAFCFTGECKKTDVLELLLERNEEEIVIRPEHVRIVSGEAVPCHDVSPTYGYLHTKECALHSMKQKKVFLAAGGDPRKGFTVEQ
jgi:hypothetical protein